MSCHWMFKCITEHDPIPEDDYYEDRLNRGNRDLAELLDAWRAGTIPKVQSVGNLQIEVCIWGSKSAPWYWLTLHPDCAINIVSEYGDLYLKDPETGIWEIVDHRNLENSPGG